MTSLSGHFFLGLRLLCFKEGALGSDMPIQTIVMAYRRSSDGMRLLRPGTSSLILSFPLSSAMGRGSGTAGLTNTVLEVEGVSVGGATYPRPVLSVGFF